MSPRDWTEDLAKDPELMDARKAAEESGGAGPVAVAWVVAWAA